MSDAESQTVRAMPTRDFSDAGSERNFTVGQAVDLTAGEFANFQAAGLVKAEPTDAPAADAGEATPPARRGSK
ncbi:hypothetical protein ACU5AX_09105 [Sphingomonas sp. XXL09]|uniref:hypothetical protein n=1 Tax=Sphingomonas sp. XXL09 TaxID=3457787 RepID=UPI00406BA92F